MILFRFGLWLGLALGLAMGLACLGSFVWPVTVYELFEVAEGPFAPGHTGKAYLPRQREPNVEEIRARLLVLLPALFGVAAAVFVARLLRGPSRAERLVTLEAWNTAGLDPAASGISPHFTKSARRATVAPPHQGE